MRFVLLALALAVTPACTASQAFVVTGESITATGRQYVETEAMMRKGFEEGKITPSQFKVWAAFSDKFELVWDSAAAAWLRARAAKKQIDAGLLGAAIAGIASELAGYAAKACTLFPQLPVCSPPATGVP